MRYLRMVRSMVLVSRSPPAAPTTPSSTERGLEMVQPFLLILSSKEKEVVTQWRYKGGQLELRQEQATS